LPFLTTCIKTGHQVIRYTWHIVESGVKHH